MSNVKKYSNSYKETGLERVKRETEEIRMMLANQGNFADVLAQMYDIEKCS